MTIFYRPEGSNIRALFTWRGTIFQAVLWGNIDLYFFMSIHVLGIFVQSHGDMGGETGQAISEYLDEHSNEILDSLSLPGTLFIFLIIFYNQHCYTRYQHYVKEAMDISRAVINFSHEATNAFGPGTDNAKNISRLMQATLILCYQEIASSIDYSTLQKQRLLHRKEIALLRECHSDQCVMTGAWVLAILHRAVLAGPPPNGLHAMQFKVLRDAVNLIQTRLTAQFDIEDVPIPFSYYHALNAISVIFLTIISLATAFCNFGTLLQCMFVPVILGIKEVASQLTNPFGPTHGDFPLSELILRNNIVCRSFFQQLGPDSQACCMPPCFDDDLDGDAGGTERGHDPERFCNGWLSDEAEQRDLVRAVASSRSAVVGSKCSS
jgi:predicted membrane chloride channel (bestrophin family)